MVLVVTEGEILRIETCRSSNKGLGAVNNILDVDARIFSLNFAGVVFRIWSELRRENIFGSLMCKNEIHVVK